MRPSGTQMKDPTHIVTMEPFTSLQHLSQTNMVKTFCHQELLHFGVVLQLIIVRTTTGGDVKEEEIQLISLIQSKVLVLELSSHSHSNMELLRLA